MFNTIVRVLVAVGIFVLSVAVFLFLGKMLGPLEAQEVGGQVQAKQVADGLTRYYDRDFGVACYRLAVVENAPRAKRLPMREGTLALFLGYL